MLLCESLSNGSPPPPEAHSSMVSPPCWGWGAEEGIWLSIPGGGVLLRFVFLHWCFVIILFCPPTVSLMKILLEGFLFLFPTYWFKTHQAFTCGLGWLPISWLHSHLWPASCNPGNSQKIFLVWVSATFLQWTPGSFCPLSWRPSLSMLLLRLFLS